MKFWRCYYQSSGPDGISATMLKQTAMSIAPGITKLMNLSISTSKFPTAWKTSSVVPVPKGSNHTSVSNYRPTSLLPILSKLLEKHVHGLILNHLNLHHPIALQQWGFQSKNLQYQPSLMSHTTGIKPWTKATKCALYFSTYRRRLTPCLTSPSLKNLNPLNWIPFW